MNVRNRHCINRLSMRQLMASKTRNLIAVFAIALTTMLFTSLFTIVMSINSSYEEYNFRQAGGYCHGTFKEVDETKIQNLSKHPKVKEYGLRTVCGFATEEPFAKVPAEISWMDANTSKWSYALPTTGRMPESGMEIAMDTAALQKLGLPAQVGTQVDLTFMPGNNMDTELRQRDVFTLVGFWEYDNLMPVHYINVSQEYLEQMQEKYLAAGGEAFRTDMNVMLTSRLNIEATMKEIDTNLGYQWQNRDAEDCVRIGVNWGYSTEELAGNLDITTILALAAFLILIIFTGYLIIYNIFQISVSTDIRFYGLLKTIGTTPRQLRRMVRLQALYLSVVGIPMGCVLGYVVGCVLSPIVIRTASILSMAKNSVSPMIFVGAALFSLVTVLISCSRPGEMAAKITPVEAVRYVENNTVSKKRRSTRGAGIGQMAFANLGRNRTKTVLVVLSLSLAVVLLNLVVIFVESFDSEKYVSQFAATDFVVGTPKYFRYEGKSKSAALPENVMEEIRRNAKMSLQGAAYSTGIQETYSICWVSEEVFRANSFYGGEVLDQQVALASRRGELLQCYLQVEGMDEELLDKLVVYEGDLAPLRDTSQKAIAVLAHTDDQGNIKSKVLQVGDKLPVTYIKNTILDSRTGEPCGEETPTEFWEIREDSKEEEYTVCALVGMPYALSYRFSMASVEAVLTRDALQRDSGQELYALFYAFDTPDEMAEETAEAFLADYTAGEASDVMYESKALLRADFEDFRNMFLILGGVLCFIVGLVGVLNFFNAILTGIVTRHREFAMLQSVGMTGRQLQRMLVYEGIFYAASAGLVSLLLCLVFRPLTRSLLENTFWFISFRYTLVPVLCAVPVFLLLGALLPLIVYRFTKGKSIVERLRENE